MLGQLAWFGVPVVPGVPVDGVDEAAGVGVADGSGLAALTMAAPPTVSRPMARRSDAATRFTPDVGTFGELSGMTGVSPEVSLSFMVIPFDGRSG
jgi:hypothetical protein